MRLVHPATLFVLTTMLAACGLPREAAQLTRTRAADPLPTDDAAIRDALLAQADTWTHLGGLLLQRELGGIPLSAEVNSKFTSLILQTAALARRQRELIGQSADDPQDNRALLQRLQSLWRSADAYLNPQ